MSVSVREIISEQLNWDKISFNVNGKIIKYLEKKIEYLNNDIKMYEEFILEEKVDGHDYDIEKIRKWENIIENIEKIIKKVEELLKKEEQYKYGYLYNGIVDYFWNWWDENCDIDTNISYIEENNDLGEYICDQIMWEEDFTY
jgi:hypothetical protein